MSRHLEKLFEHSHTYEYRGTVTCMIIQIFSIGARNCVVFFPNFRPASIHWDGAAITFENEDFVLQGGLLNSIFCELLPFFTPGTKIANN